MVGQYTEVRVLLAPHGTRGDVQPMIAFAIALRGRGHRVSFVAPSNFVGWIRTRGFDAESNGIDAEEALRAAGPNLQSIRWQWRHVVDLTATLFASIAAASAGAEVIVGAGLQPAASSVAEWRDVPYANVAYCPCVMPGRAAPPPLVRTQSLPPWINALLWQLGGPMVDVATRGAINRGRATLGLEPIDRPLAHIAGDRTILAADRDLAPLGDDAPPNAVGTDAWILEEPAELPPQVAAFLDLDPPPVYIGFGSMVSPHAPELAAHAVDAVRAVGHRAIIAGGWARLDRHVEPSSDVLTIDAVPHDLLFPRVAAVVHHGGAGTTTAAARAGAPQVVLPHILDQYYWAHRVQQLGLGPRGLPVELVTADILADRIDAALNDAGMRRRAAALGQAMAGRNGVSAAVDALEALVDSRAGQSLQPVVDPG
jgi:vancomycin aglycone glucosyltransferase